MSNLEIFLLIILILFFLYLGWKIRKIYKNFIFYLFKVRDRNAEKKAIKILKKNDKNIFLVIVGQKADETKKFIN